MANPTTLRPRIPRQQERREHELPRESSWEPSQHDDTFDVALHLASHAQRLKNIDNTLDQFEQSIKNMQAINVQERKRQNMLMGFLAAGIIAAVLVSAFFPKSIDFAKIQIAESKSQQPVIQVAPVQQPAVLQPQPIITPVTNQQRNTIAPQYSLQQTRSIQAYLAPPAPQQAAPQFIAPPQPKLSPFQTLVQGKLSVRNESIPADWQPLFDREARGDKKGKLLIAAKFLKGEGITKDQNFAVELIRQTADAGEKEAMMWLGFANQGNTFGKADIVAAIRWFEAAGKAGVNQAHTELGRIYENGVDGAPDTETALSWYKRAASAGDVKAAEAINRIITAQQTAPTTQAPNAQAPSPQPATSSTPAQQVQQLIQPVTQNQPAKSNDLFVPAPPQSAMLNNDEDMAAEPPYPNPPSPVAATPVVASFPSPSSQTGMTTLQAKSDTKAIQRMLRVLGYKVDRVDGEYGPQTSAAIRSYQRDRSVYPDGEPTPELIDALMKDVRGN